MADIETCIRQLLQVKADAPKLAANELVNFALDNIKAQSWNGVPWAPRSANAKRNTGRGLLVDTGRGRRSIKAKPKANGAELTAIDYMQFNNDGVKKTVSARSRTGKSFTRKMNLPKRQFIGDSPKIKERIETVINNRIVKALQ